MSSVHMTRIFLTHPPEALRNYYGERALTQLRSLGVVSSSSAQSARFEKKNYSLNSQRRKRSNF